MLNPIAKPIADVLAAFYAVIPNFGVAIIMLSIVWMLLISPLTLKSTRSMLAMQALQPELKRLQEKHRNDRQAFAQAQMDLFKERGVSPWGSCLPTILPLPVFFALFRVIDGLSHLSKGVSDPRYLSHNTAMYHAIVNAHGKIEAFGVNLAQNALSHHSSALAALPFYAILLVMIGTQYYQTAMTMSRNPAAQQNPQMKMMKYIPIVFGFICIRFPAGVILYYAMSNVCRIIQQFAMYRYDPKVKALVVQEVKEVEAKTREIDRAAEENKAGTSAKAITPAKGTPTPGRPKLRELLASASAANEQNKAKNSPSTRNSASAKTSGNGRGAAKAGAKPAGNGNRADSRRSPTAAKATGSAGSARSAGSSNAAGSAKSAGSSKAASTRAGGSASAKAAGPAKASAAARAAAAKGTPVPTMPPAREPSASARANSATNGNGNGTTSNGAAGPGAATSPVGAGAGARTGAGAGRNIPPRSARSKKRRGR